MEGILKKLQNLSESDFYPYHMPGHKRLGNRTFALDITEIDDFDNLHHASGIILEAQKRAAGVYGAKESFFLVNGSTCGLLTAICTSFQRGDKVLVARNCHKAVYHAIEIRGLEPIYVYPEIDAEYDISVGITAKQVSEVLENYVSAVKQDEAETANESIADSRESYNEIKGMILTSPTYEGIVSEVKEIAELLHLRDMTLIVDEAHGAHFGFHKDFPESAVTLGADLVIQSLHKTLPSMTQTALLHRCSERVKSAKIQKYLGVFQTSSPSYVFMAYMDECISLLQNQGGELFEAFARRLKHFYKKCEELVCIKVRKISDPGKVVISGGNFCGGKELYEILRTRYHLQPEMCAGNYVLAMMTICDTAEGFERLYRALAELDVELIKRNCHKETSEAGICDGEKSWSEESGQEVTVSEENSEKLKTLVSLLKERPVKKYNPWVLEEKTCEKIKLTETAGRISAEYIYLYPPGIPFIVPGEVISEKMVAALLNLRKEGYELQGPADISGDYLEVLL